MEFFLLIDLEIRFKGLLMINQAYLKWEEEFSNFDFSF